MKLSHPSQCYPHLQAKCCRDKHVHSQAQQKMDWLSMDCGFWTIQKLTASIFHKQHSTWEISSKNTNTVPDVTMERFGTALRGSNSTWQSQVNRQKTSLQIEGRNSSDSCLHHDSTGKLSVCRGTQGSAQYTTPWEPDQWRTAYCSTTSSYGLTDTEHLKMVVTTTNTVWCCLALSVITDSPLLNSGSERHMCKLADGYQEVLCPKNIVTFGWMVPAGNGSNRAD